MNLDPRTLLFSLILVNAIMVLSLFVAASGNGRREGVGKWAVAILLETLTWILVAGRGVIPDLFSVIVANGLKAGAHAMILVAVYEFQRRTLPRWQWFVPVVLTLLMSALLLDDIRGRFVWGGLIYGGQMALIAYALLSAPETRSARASKLLLGGIAMIVLVLALRAFVALSGQSDLAQPQHAGSPHPVQILSFIAILATSLLGSIGFLLMVKERADKEILHLAMTDSLTGVPNRRSLMDQAERALARRSGKPLALFMIDVDHFKLINDTHGHPAGDEVLRQISRLLEERLRGGDVLGRYGGEEFCVIAPDTDTAGALMLAESLRATIAATPLITGSGELFVTVSIGISHCPPDARRELKDVLADADAALYNAKQTGRNKVASR
ncbi:MAG TPA: GGDEF domain-containing protein [Gallionella sp.]|nr:GGDEF domain-containing protein [Gallionella sp.]